MTEDTAKNSPDFNEFWDELIEKSDWAKKNAGTVATEFKNLGILKSKPQVKEVTKTESVSPATFKQSTALTPAKKRAAQNKFELPLIVAAAVLLVTLIFIFANQTNIVQCISSHKTWIDIKASCFSDSRSCNLLDKDCEVDPEDSAKKDANIPNLTTLPSKPVISRDTGIENITTSTPATISPLTPGGDSGENPASVYNSHNYKKQ